MSEGDPHPGYMPMHPDDRALFERVWNYLAQWHFDRAIARQRLRKNRRHWNRR